MSQITRTPIHPPGSLVRIIDAGYPDDEFNRYRIHDVQISRTGYIQYFLAGRWIPASKLRAVEGQPTAELITTEGQGS